MQRIRAEVGDTIASTARAGEKMTRVEELAAQAEQYDDEIHRLASGLAASACTEDEIAANINRCAAATLQVIGESHARLAQGGSAFAELSAGIAAKCEEVLHAFNQTGYVSRANAKWLAENLMSPRVRDTLNQIANRSGAAKVRLFFKVLQNPLLKLPKEGLARCRAETDAASAELRRISERLASLDPRLATAVEDLKAGMASVENADAYVDRFKKAADDFVARAGDVTAFQSLRSALQARFPGQNNLIEYLMTKVRLFCKTDINIFRLP